MILEEACSIRNHGPKPEHFIECLNRLFQHTPPSALVLYHRGHILAAHSFLAKLPPTHPKVELIDLSGQESHQWLDPKPTCTEYPVDQFTEVIYKWLRQEPSQRPTGQTVLQLTLVSSEI